MKEELKNTGKKWMIRIGAFIISFMIGMGLANLGKSQTSEQTINNSLLWQVSGNGLDQPSYIYGTIHILCKEDFVLGETVEEALKSTSVTIMELDLDDPNLPIELQKHGVNPGMQNLSDEMKEKDIDVLNKFFSDNYGASLKELGILKPFTLTAMVLPKILECSITTSYDQEISQMTIREERELIGLETVEFQMTLFDEIPTKEQIKWLVAMIKDQDESVKEFEEMTEAYFQNDLDALFDVLIKNPQIKKYTDLLLYERNKEWVVPIEEIIKENPAFIAVGAGHLPAENGLIELLKQKGYAVEPVALVKD